jgi:dTMP kinase
MEESRGAFIVVEGTDGSGKATQAKLIASKLESAGYDVETFDFPQYDQPSSYFVKRYLNGDYGDADEVGPYTSSLFYALDRFEAAPKIRQALQEGKVIICNRFTGSNMAHQGTKIANAEQRRGFFIWLDNLEFEMLRVPRPDISFVLRVPADVAQKLVDQKDERGYTDKKRDLHEADLTHLERSVAVYDDLTQLFPKDFQRIDCVRSGTLLDIETINTMLWEKITPMLPEPSGKKPKAKSAKVAPDAATSQKPEESKAAPDEPAVEDKKEPKDIILRGVSSLTAHKIERLAPDAKLTHTDIPGIFTPVNLVPSAIKEYEAKANTLLGLYAKLVANLGKRGITARDARRAAKGVLPVATAVEVLIPHNSPYLRRLITELINDRLPEAQKIGAEIFARAVISDPLRFRELGKPTKRSAPATVRALADEHLNQNHIGDQPLVQLVTVWPRNESDLVADMLYEHTNLPLQSIQERVSRWPMDRKLEVLEAYIGDNEPGQVLEKAHYTWDLLTPYATFCDLQKQPAEALLTQPLTPRYGYDIPQLIEEADLGETYEKCFDLSLELFSNLQQAGHPVEAQYATLHGHRQRWQMTQNARQTLHTLRTPTNRAETTATLSQLHQKLSEVHPALGETFTAK